MKIIFAGDLLINNSKISISSPVEKFLEAANFRICNLEGPFIKTKSKQLIKAGPNIYQNNIHALTFLKKCNFNLVSLSNNHILDYGKESLLETITILKKNRIAYFGAGYNITDIYAPAIIESQDKKIAIFGACQAEFGVSKYEDDQIGYAWINSPILEENIKKTKDKVDFIIIYAHAGLEKVDIPLPEWRNRYRQLIDLGAEAIIATHPHVIQGYEIYNNKAIYFSIGNFIFDYANSLNEKALSTGLLLSVEVKDNALEILHRVFHIKDGILDFMPIEISEKKIKDVCDKIDNQFIYNNQIDTLSEELWHEYYNSYYLNRSNIGIKGLAKGLLTTILNKVLNKRKTINLGLSVNENLILHNIQIETHRWLVERYLHKKNRTENNINNSLLDYYKRRTNKDIDISNPTNLNEKLIWLHLNWRDASIIRCADKLQVKEYLKEKGLEEIVIPTIAKFDNAEQINFDILPSKFVLKCNHGCGYNIICEDKNQLDTKQVTKTLNTWFNEVYGLNSCEFHYQKIPPKIFIEEYLDFGSTDQIIDYKLHCINGNPYAFLICHNRKNGIPSLTSYDLQWNRINLLKNESLINIEKPKVLNKLLNTASILCKSFPYVRLDYYILNDKIYLGEMTFTPAGNVMDYYKDETLNKMGEQLRLPEKIESQW